MEGKLGNNPVKGPQQPTTQPTEKKLGKLGNGRSEPGKRSSTPNPPTNQPKRNSVNSVMADPNPVRGPQQPTHQPTGPKKNSVNSVMAGNVAGGRNESDRCVSATQRPQDRWMVSLSLSLSLSLFLVSLFLFSVFFFFSVNAKSLSSRSTRRRTRCEPVRRFRRHLWHFLAFFLHFFVFFREKEPLKLKKNKLSMSFPYAATTT